MAKMIIDQALSFINSGARVFIHGKFQGFVFFLNKSNELNYGYLNELD